MKYLLFEYFLLFFQGETMNVLAYIRRRLFFLILVLFGLSIITFTLTKIVPVDPTVIWSGDRASKEVIQKIRIDFGLDKPVPMQYYLYVSNLLKGNMGKSFTTKHFVIDDVKQFFPATLELVIFAWLFALFIGIPVGIYSAVKSNTQIDHIGRFFSLSGVSLPLFWLGLLLQILFFKKLGWFPLQGRIGTTTAIFHPLQSITGLYILDSLFTWNWIALKDALWHISLPAITLAFSAIALVTRMTRSCMLEILSKEYITMEKAYGLPDRKIYFVYALKNALVPIITIVALAIGNNFLGAILVETVFDWPGLGRYAVRSILAADFAPVMGVTLIIGTIYVFLNLLVDILYALIDPRITLFKKSK